MNEMDFDSWDDYTPVSNVEQKNQRDLLVNNKNIFILLKTDSINLVEMDESDWLYMFDNYAECDYDDVKFIRFKKDYEKDELSIFSNDDLYLVKKNDLLYILNVYQSNGYYEDDDKITFLGWDYNIVLNTKTMKSKIIDVR